MQLTFSFEQNNKAVKVYSTTIDHSQQVTSSIKRRRISNKLNPEIKRKRIKYNK